jgi:hypothetical protein
LKKNSIYLFKFLFQQRPSSRGGPLGSNMRIKVEDAPMTRGGLGGFQNAGGLGGRQVQDRTYFVGIVR